MTRRIASAAAAIVALIVSAPSLAADLPRPAAIYKSPQYYSPAFTWSGFYAGLNGGYGWGSSAFSTAAGTSDTFRVSGPLIGSTFGYNFQSSSFVYGIEGDIDYSWIKGTNGGAAPCAGCEVLNTYLGTVRGRLGNAFDQWLPYFTGGLAVGGVRTSTPAGAVHTNNRAGWTLGGGVEYAFLGGWSTKLEYLYVDLAKARCPAAFCGVSTEVDFQTHIVRMGLNTKF